MLKLTSMSKFQIVLTLFALIFFTSCQKDPNNNNTVQGSMTIEIDSVSQTPTNFSTNNTLISVEEYGEMGRRFDIRANIGSDQLIISASNWDFQNPPAGGILTKTYDTNTSGGTGPNQYCEVRQVTFCDGGLATYISNGTNHVSQSMSSEPTGAITITQNNTVDKTISGTIDVKVIDFIQQNAQPIRITGTFTDLPYRVLN